MKNTRSTLERFDSFWKKQKRTGCWLWQGVKNRHRQGLFWFSGTIVSATKVSWILRNGAIPNGKVLVHRCENVDCVNPLHLFLGSQKDRSALMMKKGTHAHGVKHGCAFLTEKKIFDIRAATGSQREIAAVFGISKTHVRDIRRRKLWRHL